MPDPVIKPNFYVIGAGKAGTTSLCDLLGAHPDVFMSDPKEPQFYTERWKLGWDWYNSLFRDAAGCRAIGEGSTTYSEKGFFPEALPRLVEHTPEARIIYITRSPLERLESMWIQLRFRGLKVPADFCKAMRTWPEFVDSSLYWTQINAYRQHFPDDRILVLFLDDLQADPDGVLRRCFEFLGVDPSVRIEQADQPRNVWSDGKHEDRAALSALRRIPGYDGLRDALVPKALRRGLKSFFVRPIRRRPRWDDETRAWVLEQIGDDVRRFLEFYGRPADFWPLGPSASHPASS